MPYFHAAEQVTITLSAASMVDEGAMLEIGFTAVDGNGTAIMSDFDFVLTYTDDIAGKHLYYVDIASIDTLSGIVYLTQGLQITLPSCLTAVVQVGLQV